MKSSARMRSITVVPPVATGPAHCRLADPPRGQRNHYLSRANAFFDHQCEITSGVLQKECAAILQDFFRKRRSPQAGEL
jgi:hypothetical protein